MQPKTVFLCENNATIREEMSAVLKSSQYAVQFAGALSDALDQLSKNKYDCIVLDLQIDGGRGEDIVDQISFEKKHKNYNTPIIIISGFVDADFKENYKQSVNSILSKPFKMSELLEVVKEAVQS